MPRVTTVLVLSCALMGQGCKETVPAPETLSGGVPAGEQIEKLEQQTGGQVAAEVKEMAKVADEAQAQPAVAAPATPKIDCDKLVPQALRDTYFKGLPLHQVPMCEGCPDQCKFAASADDGTAPSVLADCRFNQREAWFEKVTRNWDKNRIDGLGRAARTSMGMQVSWVPKDHDCMLTITWMNGGAKSVELAKAIEAGLTPAALGK